MDKATYEAAFAAGRPTICCDFDGVFHKMDGEFSEDEIIGPSVDGWYEFLESAVDKAAIAIFSTRSQTPAGIALMKDYLKTEADEMGKDPDLVDRVLWADKKPPAKVYLDDRGLTFTGTFPPIEVLLAFKTWDGR